MRLVRVRLFYNSEVSLVAVVLVTEDDLALSCSTLILLHLRFLLILVGQDQLVPFLDRARHLACPVY
jgi:hypothetical protein